MPLVSRTRASLRSAEFGFFGVWVKTRTQTPRFCGLFCNAGLFVLVTIFLRPSRTSWLIVGINANHYNANHNAPRTGATPVASGLEALSLDVARKPRASKGAAWRLKTL